MPLARADDAGTAADVPTAAREAVAVAMPVWAWVFVVLKAISDAEASAACRAARSASSGAPTTRGSRARVV
jgi:hypothetical protein